MVSNFCINFMSNLLQTYIIYFPLNISQSEDILLALINFYWKKYGIKLTKLLTIVYTYSDKSDSILWNGCNTAH